MVVKLKRLDTSKITTNLKNTFYVDKEIQDIMNKYQIKRNVIIFSFFSKIIIDTELKISAYTYISTSYPMMYHTLL